MNISGILVQTKPQYLDEVIENIKASSYCEYHLHDDNGRIVATLEGENVEEEMTKLKKLLTLKHVISADMMYSYSEDELSNLKMDLNKENEVPEWLNDPNIKAEDIKYNGDLKKKY